MVTNYRELKAWSTCDDLLLEGGDDKRNLYTRSSGFRRNDDLKEFQTFCETIKRETTTRGATKKMHQEMLARLAG